MYRLRTAAVWAWRYAHWALPGIAAITVASGQVELIGPVLDNGGDNASHMLAEFALAHALEAGDNPFGPLPLDYGLPILRFYQSLFYLACVGLHALTALDLRLVHNLLVAVCFTLSPLAYCYFLRKLGLRRFAAGLGSLLALMSVGSFGNSFEAYHGIGIATQAMGALFFPLFMGGFVGMLRGENHWSSTAILFALAFLSHAMMAVYAVLSGALYFLVARVGVRPNWKRLLLFALLGATLVSFWALPFVSHTQQLRSEPDSITRGQAKRFWFNSVSEHEMVRLAASGRLLDDPPELRSRQTDPLDKLMEKVSMGVTVRTRFPVVTALTALGLLVALFGFRRSPQRFLAAGLAFALFLWAGTDDYPLFGRLPLIDLVQKFRCTYLVEFFAYGLAGLGLEALLRHLFLALAASRRVVRGTLGGAAGLAVLAGIFLAVAEIALLARLNVRVHPQAMLDAQLDAARSLDNAGYPFRTATMGRWNSQRAWLASGGIRSACSHWGAIAPTSSFYLCLHTRNRPQRADLHALAGVRYVAGRESEVRKYLEARDGAGDPLYSRLANGPDSRGKSNAWHFLLDSGRDHFLRPLVGAPLPVVCDDRQWLWIADGWVRRYHSRLRDPATPVPMRVRAGELGASGLLPAASALLYLDVGGLAADRAALAAFAAGGGVVVSPFALEGIHTRRVETSLPLWSYVEPRPLRKGPPAGFDEHDDPGLDRVAVLRHEDPARSSQRYWFDVDVREPTVAILPTAAVPGWTAQLDGEPLATHASGPDLVGVLLPAGAHRLAFRWQMPGWHRVTLIVSIAALVFALVAWFAVAAGRRLLARDLARTEGRGGS